MKVCTFFGHRDSYGVDIDQLKALIRTAICDYGCTQFWCGGYGAFDSIAAQTVRSMKEEYPHIRLVRIYAYLPSGADGLDAYYDETILPEGQELAPKRYAISRRNEWIADHCDAAIACISLPSGGAFRAVKRIMRQKKPVWNLGSLPLEGK